MAALEKLTVRALRALARRRLGPGFSKLKTRGALLDALQAVRSTAERANGSRPPLPPVPAPAPKATQRTRRAPGPATPGAVLAGSVAQPEPSPPPSPFTSEAEELGELPESYDEDSVVLLPKDPTTLYLYWDFSPATQERAFAWMPGLRTRLRLFDGDRILREAEFSVAARSWYFYGLVSGRAYRVELLAFANDGQVRRIGRSSNPVRLPTLGPSHHRDDRFVHIPFDAPTPRLAEALRENLHSNPPGPIATAGTMLSMPFEPPRSAGSWTGRAATALPPRSAAPVQAPEPMRSRLPSFVRFVEPLPFEEAARELISPSTDRAGRGARSSSSRAS